MITRHEVSTGRRCQMVDITPAVSYAVHSAGIEEGMCVVYCPHTTAGVRINEGADPDVAADILAHLEKLVPASGGYKHAEGNADAHIKSTLVGSSVTVIVENGHPALGTWQKIFFCEFDGPRQRKVIISVR